jgi:hypothetical protein
MYIATVTRSSDTNATVSQCEKLHALLVTLKGVHSADAHISKHTAAGTMAILTTITVHAFTAAACCCRLLHCAPTAAAVTTVVSIRTVLVRIGCKRTTNSYWTFNSWSGASLDLITLSSVKPSATSNVFIVHRLLKPHTAITVVLPAISGRSNFIKRVIA